jgi:hypothetical protein
MIYQNSFVLLHLRLILFFIGTAGEIYRVWVLGNCGKSSNKLISIGSIYLFACDMKSSVLRTIYFVLHLFQQDII